MATDTLGRPLRFILTAGQSGDILAAPALLDGFAPQAVLADKAYDSNALRAIIANAGAEPVIPSNRSRKVIIPHNRRSTNIATASNDASISSSTSAASQHATTEEHSTSSASYNSPQP